MKREDQSDRDWNAENARKALKGAVGRGDGDLLLAQIERDVRRRRVARRSLIGATMMAVMVGVVTWYHLGPSTKLVTPSELSKSVVVHGPQVQILADGSRIEFTADADFGIDYTSSERGIILRKGRAFFQVQPDTVRPFVVKASEVNVHAVGTAFVVELRAESIDVVVTHGRVAVGTVVHGRSDAPPLLLDAGEQISVGPTSVGSSAIQELSPDALAARTAWRVPRLELNGTPLAEVIPMFNAHAPVPLRLSPELGSLRMSGVLRADNIKALLRLLRDEFGISATPTETSELFLHR